MIIAHYKFLAKILIYLWSLLVIKINPVIVWLIILTFIILLLIEYFQISGLLIISWFGTINQKFVQFLTLILAKRFHGQFKFFQGIHFVICKVHIFRASNHDFCALNLKALKFCLESR